LALTAVHNFITVRDGKSDVDYKDLEEFNIMDWTSGAAPSVEDVATPARAVMLKLRDEIAEQMWVDYIEILRYKG
jgi:hypothetical protein